jgi:protein-S-isoprenylcysteine O-methyltransferase Ste14
MVARVRTAGATAGSAAFLVVAPGVVAGLVPWLLTGWDSGAAPGWFVVVRFLGAVLVLGGAAALLSAFARFVLEGRGTPAPVAPTEQLVIGGLYRYVRNPMYVAVVLVIVGQAMLLARPVLLVYAIVAWAVMAAFVRWYEEPVLRRRYGPQYDDYRRSVPAWWPRGPGRPGLTSP